MAGLWREWSGEEQTIPSVTILTTDPNDLVEPIHDRMPVVLPTDEEETWLTAGPDERADLCQPYPKDDLTAYEISTSVNDDPSVLRVMRFQYSERSHHLVSSRTSANNCWVGSPPSVRRR